MSKDQSLHENSILFLSFPGKLVTHAQSNAPLLDHKSWQELQLLPQLKNTEKLPLVVFSHRLTSIRGLYSVFCAQLASEGFVVAAVEHRFIYLSFSLLDCDFLCTVLLSGSLTPCLCIMHVRFQIRIMRILKFHS